MLPQLTGPGDLSANVPCGDSIQTQLGKSRSSFLLKGMDAELGAQQWHCALRALGLSRRGLSREFATAEAHAETAAAGTAGWAETLGEAL